jgi:hypothetical protein
MRLKTFKIYLNNITKKISFGKAEKQRTPLLAGFFLTIK